MTPLAYYRDSPVLLKDDVLEGLVRTSRAAHGESGDQMRVLNGIYLTTLKLRQAADAEEAFGRVVAYGIAHNRLGVKFLFNPGSTDFWSDPGSRAPPAYGCDRSPGKVAARVCMDVVGHSSKTGAEEVNDSLSLRRAQHIRQRLAAESGQRARAVVALWDETPDRCRREVRAANCGQSHGSVHLEFALVAAFAARLPTEEKSRMNDQDITLQEALRDHGAVVAGWLSELGVADPAQQRSVQTEAGELVRSLQEGLARGGDPSSLSGPAWGALREMLEDLSRSRAAKGETAGDTNQFVLALKRPLFDALQRRQGETPERLIAGIWSISTLVDRLAQHTATTFQKSREEIIRRQQDDLLELSTPVVKLWEGVLAVPMIGVLDSNRTQIVMETLLQSIVDTGSGLAIIDITGVPTVDTLVAQHLLKTVTAIRLMGADCIISGIRPQIAQTIVHLGIDLQGITTKATLADALSVALLKTGWRITREN